MEHLFYTDGYTKRIADEIARENKIVPEFFKITNPTSHRWVARINRNRSGRRVERRKLPPGSVLIGGNRWRHHYALNLTDLPIISIDAHTDMNYDEMIALKFVRPYNWLYFRLLEGFETHLVLPYSDFRGGRWNIVIPEKFADRFYLYSFDDKKSWTKVSLSFTRSKTVEVRHVERIFPIPALNKQISLDWDITREVQQDRVEWLLARISKDGDVCDIWLDEGKRGRRNALKDHVGYCSRIYEILDNA